MTKKEYDALPDGACLWHAVWIKNDEDAETGQLVFLMDRKGRFDASKVDLRWYSVAEEAESEIVDFEPRPGKPNDA